MDKKIKNHVVEYCKQKGYPIEERDIIETITESDIIFEANTSSHRWWTTCFRVCVINGLEIGYVWANTTGDDSAKDKGWEFDPDSICEVIKKEITTIIYEKK